MIAGWGFVCGRKQKRKGEGVSSGIKASVEEEEARA